MGHGLAIHALDVGHFEFSIFRLIHLQYPEAISKTLPAQSEGVHPAQSQWFLDKVSKHPLSRGPPADFLPHRLPFLHRDVCYVQHFRLIGFAPHLLDFLKRFNA